MCDVVEVVAWNMAIAPIHERSQRARNESQWIFLDYADGGAREGESWKKNSW